MSPEHGCPSLFFLTRCHVSPQNLRTLRTLSLKCLKFRCLSLGPWGHEKTAETTSWAFWGVNLPRLLVLWQHWQSKPQRINFVLALLWIGINFLWSGFFVGPQNMFFVGCQLCWINFFCWKKLGYLRWSKLLGAFEPTQTCWKLMNRWWHPIQPWRKRRTNPDVRKIDAKNVHRSLGWAPLSNCGKSPGITVKKVQ